MLPVSIVLGVVLLLSSLYYPELKKFGGSNETAATPGPNRTTLQPPTQIPPVTPEFATKVHQAQINPRLEPQINSGSESQSELRPVMDLADLMQNTNHFSSRHMALKAAMILWKLQSEIKPYLDILDDDQAFFELAAKQNGLLVHRVDGDFNLIRRLNLPAIMQMRVPENQAPAYVTLAGIEGDKIIIKGGEPGDLVEVPASAVQPYWSGVAYILWKNFHDYAGTIPYNASKDSVLALKMHLRDIGYEAIELTPVYDIETQKAIEQIQAKYEIPVDGFVGPLTKIALYNEKKTLFKPHLSGD
jgi:general secretion pathway protein A